MARNVEEPACTFCGTPASTVKVIAGPDIMICAGCVAKSVEIAISGGSMTATEPEQKPLPLPQGGLLQWLFPNLFKRLPIKPTCSFCGGSEATLVRPPSTRELQELICTTCLGLCQDIIREERPAQRDRPE